jgi:hypothetical protein
MTDRSVVIEGRQVFVSHHAIARYHERVRPMTSPGEAEEELIALLEKASFTIDQPDWAASRPSPHGEWVMLGDRVACVIAEGHRLTTVLVRSQVGSTVRWRNG